MEVVLDILRRASAGRNSPRAVPLAHSSQPGASENRPRTLTAIAELPESWGTSPQSVGESVRPIGGTTAGANLTRTAPELKRAPRRLVLVGTVAAALLAGLAVGYRLLAP